MLGRRRKSRGGRQSGPSSARKVTAIKWLKKIGTGVIQANLPSFSRAAGLYYTFMDRPFALRLALLNMESTLISDSITGALTPIAVEGLKNVWARIQHK